MGVFGPKSRMLMQVISKDNFSNESFKFSTGKYITIKNILVWAQRISYVGELGYELYVKFNDAKEIYQTIIKEGKKFNISNCGTHSMDILRMENGFLHWGHDMSPEENPYETGLDFTISYKKNTNFIGKQSLLKIKDKKLDKRLLMFELKDSEPGKPLLLHDEPIYLNNKIIGRTTSGNYSFNYNKNISYGFVNSGNTVSSLENKEIFIEVEKKKYLAKVLPKKLSNNNYKKI